MPVQEDDDDDPPIPEAWRSKPFRLCVIAAAAILAAGVGFGVGKATGVGNNVVLSGIPSPSKAKNAFIEDSNGIAEDTHDNIFESTAPGLVHVLAGGTSVGIGMVITESGKVLTTYLPPAGATNLSMQYVISRNVFKATVIGVDRSAGLALLQMQGGVRGRPFSVLQIGNSDTLAQSAAASRMYSYHVPGTIYDTAVGTTGKQNALSIDGGTLITQDASATDGTKNWSGLMESKMQASVPSAIGGPLVNLNGQMIGVTIGGAGTGLDIVSYAIPINTVLAIATQIDDGNY